VRELGVKGLIMTQQDIYKFKMDDGSDLELNLQEGVFTPTGTTIVLVKAIRSYVDKPGKMVDLGCGCGVTGIALNKLGLVESPLYASDLSKNSVHCTIENALKYDCKVIAQEGSLFEPWEGEKFDYIVNDVSGIAEEIAKVSPWFDKVSCKSGKDGAELVSGVIRKSKDYLKEEGLLFFPVISFSDEEKILSVANENFSCVEQLVHEEWPLPKEMYEHLQLLERLKQEGYIQFSEKFGMVLWFTDIYVAYNKK